MSESQTGSTGSNGHDPATSGADPDGPADETFGWTAPDDETPPAAGDARAAAERMLGQLQSMIDTVATQAAPVSARSGRRPPSSRRSPRIERAPSPTRPPTRPPAPA